MAQTFSRTSNLPANSKVESLGTGSGRSCLIVFCVGKTSAYNVPLWSGCGLVTSILGVSTIAWVAMVILRIESWLCLESRTRESTSRAVEHLAWNHSERSANIFIFAHRFKFVRDNSLPRATSGVVALLSHCCRLGCCYQRVARYMGEVWTVVRQDQASRLTILFAKRTINCRA